MTDGVARLPPTRAALNDLRQAVDRLESALANREAGASVKAHISEQVKLDEARSDYAKLNAAARQIEAGLDDLISRLKSALEE
jgi:hypothetical protein